MLLFLLFLLPIILFLCLIWAVYYPPTLLIQYFQQQWPDVLWHASTTDKIIALTIDDGPSAYTAEIQTILKANNATATFFVIGSHVLKMKSEGPQILQELVRDGNELGNHAMFDEASYKLSSDELVCQISACDELTHNAQMGALADHPRTVAGDCNFPKYFRPGHGWYTQNMRNIVRTMGYRLVLGDIYPHDPFISFPSINAAHILRMARPGGIIICHDGRSWTLSMLKEVLPELNRRGYKVVNVTELLQYASS